MWMDSSLQSIRSMCSATTDQVNLGSRVISASSAAGRVDDTFAASNQRHPASETLRIFLNQLEDYNSDLEQLMLVLITDINGFYGMFILGLRQAYLRAGARTRIDSDLSAPRTPESGVRAITARTEVRVEAQGSQMRMILEQLLVHSKVALTHRSVIRGHIGWSYFALGS